MKQSPVSQSLSLHDVAAGLANNLQSRIWYVHSQSTPVTSRFSPEMPSTTVTSPIKLSVLQGSHKREPMDQSSSTTSVKQVSLVQFQSQEYNPLPHVLFT